VDATKSFVALNDELVINTSDPEAEDLLIDLRGAFVGTVQLQVSGDGVNYTVVQVLPVDGSAGVTSMTAAGTWKCSALAVKNAKAKCTAYTSGTIIVTLRSMRWT